MNKILILKNDRVGDLFNSLDGINAIIEDNQNTEIEIILSQISENLRFLFNQKNVTVSILPYRLSVFDKFKLFKKVISHFYEKIYILAPKNFYYYLPLFTKSKFFAITINNSKKSRPFKFLQNRIFKYIVNDRCNKKKGDSISSLTFRLCANKPINQYNNILNNNPKCSNLLNNNISFFSNFIHFHYKDSVFKKNGWSNELFFKLLSNIAKKERIILTSDYGNCDYHEIFLNNYPYINFDTLDDKYDINKNINYLHNINIRDLFKLISLSKIVIAPHGAMTVMASYLKIKVIDIFDTTINIKSFREYKPNNKNYNFLIIKPNFKKILFKINNLL